MRKALRKILAIGILTVVFTVSVTGCVGKIDSVSENFAQVDSTEIKFSWWGNDGRHKYTMTGVDIFQEQNPDIKVNYSYSIWQGYEKRYQVAMESHRQADVMQINYAWLSQYSPTGEGYYDLYELSDYIDLSQYTEEDLKYGTINGKLNALPIAFNTPEFFYNKTIWDSYGLAIPTSWEDFFDAAKIMKKDGVYPLGLVKKQAFLLVLAYEEQKIGRPVFNDNGELNIKAEDMKDMIVFFSRLLDERVIPPVDEFSRKMVEEKKVATVMCWVSDAGNYCAAIEGAGEVYLGGQLVEEGAIENGWYIKPSSMYAISKYTDHPEESARLINYLVNSPDMATLQLAEKGIPVSASALDAVKSVEGGLDGYDAAAGEYMIQNMNSMRVIRPIMENEDVISALKSCTDDYKYKASTLEKACHNLYDRIDALTKE